MTAQGVRHGYWRDVARIHRLEYPFPVHYLCHSALGACYAAQDVAPLLTGPVLLALLATLLSVVGGNPLNAAVDVSTDARTEKAGVAGAVLRVGHGGAVRWAAAELGGAVVLATALAVWLGRPLIAAGVILAVVLCVLYNVEPVRLKRRGAANPLTIGLTLGLLPCLASHSAVRPDIPGWACLVFAGVTVLITGRALWWIVPDRDADQATGMRTPAVAYGAFGSLSLACAATVAGLLLLAGGLWWAYGPLPTLLAVAVNGAFLVGKLRLLRRREALPGSRQMRTRGLSPVLLSDVLLVVLPIVAGP